MVRPTNLRLVTSVIEAIERLCEGKGSTARSILNYIRQHMNLSPRNLTMQVHKALKNAVSAGLLQHRSGRYKAQIALKPSSTSTTPRSDEEKSSNAKRDETVGKIGDSASLRFRARDNRKKPKEPRNPKKPKEPLSRSRATGKGKSRDCVALNETRRSRGKSQGRQRATRKSKKGDNLLKEMEDRSASKARKRRGWKKPKGKIKEIADRERKKRKKGRTKSKETIRNEESLSITSDRRSDRSQDDDRSDLDSSNGIDREKIEENIEASKSGHCSRERRSRSPENDDSDEFEEPHERVKRRSSRSRDRSPERARQQQQRHQQQWRLSTDKDETNDEDNGTSESVEYHEVPRESEE